MTTTIYLKGQQGSALIMTMMSMMLMTVLGLALVFSASNENLSSNSETLANQAYYAAEAGLDEAVMVLRGNRVPLGSTNTSETITQNQINLQVGATLSSSNRSTDAATFARLSRWLPYSATNVTASDLTLPLPANAAVVLNPTEPVSKQLSYQIQIIKLNATDIQITSTGIAPQGARRSLKMKLKDAGNIPGKFGLTVVPAAVTLLGNQPKGTVGNSAAKSLSGKDCGGTSEKPIVGAVGQTNANYAWNNSLKNQAGQYETTYSNATSGIVADISVPNSTYGVTGDIPFNNNQTKAEQFITEVSQVAHRVVNSGASLTLADMGTTTNPKVVLVKGDMTLTNSGTGLLVVTGKLTLSGNFNYEGLIIVLGKGEVLRNGGGNGQIKGGIIIGKYDNTTLDDSEFDPNAWLSTNGGGNSLIQYCTASINKALGALPTASITSLSH